MKKKIVVTFTDDEFQILAAAQKVIDPDGHAAGCFAGTNKTALSLAWVARWAALAVSSEILRVRHMATPLAVVWRNETPEELARRLGNYQDGSDGEVVWSRF